jgi:hypothetical protein
MAPGCERTPRARRCPRGRWDRRAWRPVRAAAAAAGGRTAGRREGGVRAHVGQRATLLASKAAAAQHNVLMFNADGARGGSCGARTDVLRAPAGRTRVVLVQRHSAQHLRRGGGRTKLTPNLGCFTHSCTAHSATCSCTWPSVPRSGEGAGAPPGTSARHPCQLGTRPQQSRGGRSRPEDTAARPRSRRGPAPAEPPQ